MFFFILRYEWLSLRANKLLLILAAIIFFITFFALYDGYSRIEFQKNAIKEISHQQKADYVKYRQQIANAKSGQHFDGGHYGDPTNPFYFGNRMGAQYAVLEPAPLSIISTGQSDIYPYYFKVTLSKKQALYHSEELENPRILFNGRFDLSFVIIFLLPLLIIAFTYNVYSSEKENGTLSLLLTQNTPVKKIISYRFLIRYLLFNIYFTVITLTGLIYFGVNISETITGIAGMMAMVWSYTAFWFALSLLVNMLKTSSGFSASALTGAWLMLVLIIPTAISSVVDMVHPMPSRLDLITATRNTSDSISKNKNILNRFFEDHPEFKPANADPADRNPVTLRNRIELELATEKLKSVYRQVADRREAIVRKYRFLSPAIFIQQQFNKTAGTDDERYKDFDRRVLSYQQQFRNYFGPLVYRQEKFTVAHLDGVPPFIP